MLTDHAACSPEILGKTGVALHCDRLRIRQFQYYRHQLGNSGDSILN